MFLFGGGNGFPGGSSDAVAAKMLADHEPVEKIMRYCDLPEEEILLIREKGSEYNHN